MPSLRFAGGRSFVTPALETDIDLEAENAEELVYANWHELQAAYAMAGRRDEAELPGGFAGNNGTVVLPAGTIYASTPPEETPASLIQFDERLAGITIQGAGRQKTLLVDPYSSLPAIQISSRRISYLSEGEFEKNATTVTLLDPEVAAEDEVLYFWNYNSGGTRSDRQRVRITDITSGVATFTPELSETWNRFRHFIGYEVSNGLAVGDSSVDLVDPAHEEFFRVNDDVVISDGPAINESFVEWLRVTKITTSMGGVKTVHFTPPVRQAYEEGLTCLLPAPHLSDITIRDLSIAGPVNNADRFMGYIKLGVRIQMENVDFVPDGTDWEDPVDEPAQFNILSSGIVTIDHFRTRGYLLFNVTHDAVVNDVWATQIAGEEYCFDFFFTNITTDGIGFRFDTVGASQRIHVTNALFMNYGFTDDVSCGIGFAAHSRIANVTIMMPRFASTMYLISDISLDNVSMDIPLIVIGTDVRLNNLTVPEGVTFHHPGSSGPDSSGVMLSPLLPDPSKVHNTTAAGQWFRPMFVTSDGTANLPVWDNTPGATAPGLVLSSPAADKVPLTIQAADSQTADLQQWKNDEGNVLFAILDDGNIASTNIESSSPPGSANKRLVICDETGSPHGYIPIHPLS